MKLRKLGKFRPEVSVVGLGCNNFGLRIDLEASRKVIQRALEVGITLFDTADIYGNRGGSEEHARASPRRQPQARRAGHEIRRRDGRSGKDEGRLTPLHYVCRRGQPEALAHRLDRSISDSFPRSGYAHRRNAPRPRRSDTRKAKCAISAARILPPGNSWTRSGPQNTLICIPSSPARMNTACWSAAWNANSCRPCRSSESACCHIFLWPAACSPENTRATNPSPKIRAFRPSKASRIGISPNRIGKLWSALNSLCAKRGHTLLELAFTWLLARPTVASVIAGATKPEQVEQNAKAADWRAHARRSRRDRRDHLASRRSTNRICASLLK